MDWISDFFDPEILKDIEAIEEDIASKPGFDLFRKEIRQSLIKDSHRLSGFTAQEIIQQVDTFEELIVVKDYLQGRFAGDHVWWEDYHKRRIELAMLPSNYGTLEGKARFALPVTPQTFKRSSVAGIRGVGVKRNLAGQLFTHRQLQGLDPVQISTQGVRFQDFLHAQRPPAKSYFAFDIETTGLLRELAHKKTGADRGVASLGFSFRNLDTAEEGLSMINVPKSHPYYGEFIEEKILPRHKKLQQQTAKQIGIKSSMFQKTATEVQIVKQFIEQINRDKSAAIMGYNIEQFDIPFMQMMAKRHGIEKQFASAMKGREIIDVGHHAKAFLSDELSGTYVGWQKGMFEELKLNPAGWKQEAVAAALGYKGTPGAAHTPLEDVRMTEFIYNKLTADKTGDTARKSFSLERYKAAVKELGQTPVKMSELKKMTIEKGGQTFLDLPNWMVPKEPRSTSFADRLGGTSKAVAEEVASAPASNIRGIFEAAPDREIASKVRGSRWAAPVGKGAKLLGAGIAIAAVAPGEGLSNVVGAGSALGAYYAAKGQTGKAGLGFAAGVAAYGIVKGLNSLAFSGRDDNYNIIEGLRHGGAAQAKRLELTEFGSGYQGQKLSIYNQDIDPEIQEFRHRWLSTPTQEKLLKEEMKAAGESVQQVRDLENSEMVAAGRFQKISLNDYTWSFEDPDTILLRRKGLWNIFEDQVAVRMTGIDAPEIEHDNDALDWTRYEQDQPYGQEATARAKARWEGKEGMYLLVDPGRQTYGRYLGILKEEGVKESVNVQMIQEGMAAALPWGDSGSDMISRSKLMAAERTAIAEEKGMWQEEYFQRYLDISGAVGKRITFTSFSDLSRLSKNYSLAAAQELMTRDDIDYEPWMGRYIGSKLRKSHGPIKNIPSRNNAYNTMEGLHPGSNGMGAQSVRSHSDFGSGSVIKAGLGKVSGKISSSVWEKAAPQYKSVLQKAFKERLGKDVNIGIKHKSFLGNNSIGIHVTDDADNVLMSITRNVKEKANEVHLKNIALNPDLRGTGVAGEFYRAERSILGASGVPAGTPIVSNVQSAITARLQQKLYGAKLSPFKETDEALWKSRDWEQLVADKKLSPRGQMPDALARGTMPDNVSLDTNKPLSVIPGKDDAYNAIEGLHPGSEGMGAESIRKHTDFGSGWQAGGMVAAVAAGIAGIAGAVFVIGRKFGQDIVKSVGGEGVEFEGQRARRKRQEKVEEGKLAWARNVARQRYANTVFFAEESKNYVSTGGWQRSKNGGKFSAMGNESEGAWGAVIRAGITEFKGDFASRWDPVRKIATELFGDSPNALQKLKNTPSFEFAIERALKSEGKFLGAGKTSKVMQHTASFDYGGKVHSFDFVAKVPRTIDEMVAGAHGQEAMPRTVAETLQRVTQKWIPAEQKALSTLDDMADTMTTGYYGRHGDVLTMEKVDIVASFDDVAMRADEAESLTAFMKRAHGKGITHTDLHGENMVRVMSPDEFDEAGRLIRKGKEEAMVLDWGTSNRLSGPDPDAWINKQILVQKMSKESMGKPISIEEYSKLADLKRIDAFYKGQTGHGAHGGINTLMHAGNEEGAREAIGEVLAFGGGKRLAAEPIEFAGTGQVVADEDAWGLDDFFTSGSLAGTAPSKPLPTPTGPATEVLGGGNKAQREAQKAIKQMQEASDAGTAAASPRAKAKMDPAFADTVYHMDESTVLHAHEATIPSPVNPKQFMQSKAQKMLRATSDKICRVPFQMAEDAGKGHRRAANRMR